MTEAEGASLTTSAVHDQRAQALAQAGDFAEAVQVIVTAHGPGVLGYLQAMAPSPDVGEELYAIVCERLWLALPTLHWELSPRTWMYAVGRNLLRDHFRGARPVAPLSQVPELRAAIRSTTATYRRTAAKSKLARLREALDPEDRTLLILRVDREMPWREIARILAQSEGDADVGAAELAKIGARARKRFERVKLRLREAWAEDREEDA